MSPQLFSISTIPRSLLLAGQERIVDTYCLYSIEDAERSGDVEVRLLWL